MPVRRRDPARVPGPGPGPGWAIAAGATTNVMAAQTTAEATAASRADIWSKVTPVIFTY